MPRVRLAAPDPRWAPTERRNALTHDLGTVLRSPEDVPPHAPQYRIVPSACLVTRAHSALFTLTCDPLVA
jgi:hypothetical protein